MHFCYGLGGFLAPLVAEPFLRNIDCSPLIDNTTAPADDISQEALHHGCLLTPPFRFPPHLGSHWRHYFHIPRSLTEAQSKIEISKAFIILAVLQVETFKLDLGRRAMTAVEDPGDPEHCLPPRPPLELDLLLGSHHGHPAGPWNRRQARR